MLTTASNPGQGPGHPGPGGAKVQGFPAGYLPAPNSGNPGGGQTLVFGHVGVLGSPQSPPSLQQQQQQQSANKQDQVQKVIHREITKFVYLYAKFYPSIFLIFFFCFSQFFSSIFVNFYLDFL